MDYQEAAESGLLAELEMREERDGPGPRLWDADPDVCCAAFQLGACDHTETWSEDDIEDALSWDSEEAAVTFTGREEPCGLAGGRVMVARALTDGTWSWYGFNFPTLVAARCAASKAGF